MKVHEIRRKRLCGAPVSLVLIAFLGTIAQPVSATGQVSDEKAIASQPPAPVSSLAVLSQFQSNAEEEYTIGEGDQLEVQVTGRPELSGTHLVGPDGRITLPIAGSFDIRNMTREEAATNISSLLEHYYTAANVTVRVSKYGSNRILILGHVDQPGVLYFEGAPSLFDVLTRSRRATLGPGQPALPKRCAIFRGKDQAVWIDLQAMMDTGTAAADLRLRRNDVVFVPDELDDQVSVLGEVQRPGMVRLQAKTTLAEVLAMSGGLTANAGSAKIEIVRPGSRTTQEIAFNDLVDPRKNIEASLHSGDVIYVQKGSMAKFAYVLQQLAPISGMLMFASQVK